MEENVMDKLRLRFEKTGRAVYISHLDLMHTIQRGFSRAGYELKYSEGYNPHPIISIALPLSVGASSCCEILDFKLKGDTDLSVLPEKLNNALPEGITVVEAYEAERKPSEIKWLEINGTFEYDGNNAEAMLPKLSEFFSTDEIVIEKRTKRGMGEADIKPMIREISFTAPNSSEVLLNAVISAQEPTLNPEHLVSALLQKAPEIAPDFAKFERINIFDADMAAFR